MRNYIQIRTFIPRIWDARLQAGTPDSSKCPPEGVRAIKQD
jgi:hypothetical protein